MLPVLFHFGPIKIYTFGVFLVLAFFWGSFLLWKNIRLTSYKEEEVFDGVFIGLAGGLFLARLFYVILNFKDFGFNLLKFILINGYPGLSLYGFVLGFLFFLYLFLSIKKITFLVAIDYFVGPAFLSLAFGKLGAFFSGTEVGTKTNFFLAIKYTGFESNRHLVGFYEGLLFFLGFYLAQKILFEIRREKLFNGFLLIFFIWYLSLIYFLFDKIKVNHLYLKAQSFNLTVSKILLLTTSVYFIYYFRELIKNYGQKIFQSIYLTAKRIVRKAKRRNLKKD
ncbi:MAG: prolipoprotein diacylglyceryl transferase family protein [Microgenomates group bacterium]